MELEENNKQRVTNIMKMIEEGYLFTTGDQIVQFINVSKDKQQPVPVFIFVRKTQELPGVLDERPLGTVSLATPTGLALFEAGDLYKYCQDKAREDYFKDMETMFKKHTTLNKSKLKPN